MIGLMKRTALQLANPTRSNIGAKLVKTQVRAMSKTIHDFAVKSLQGDDVSLSQYKGKVVLIENVASL